MKEDTHNRESGTDNVKQQKSSVSSRIDLIEQAMKNAYLKEAELPEMSAAWKSSIMERINEDFSPEDTETEIIEKKFLYFSWVAAGVAAALVIISTITFSLQQNNFEDDIHELYADNTLDDLTMAMVSK
jgi:hypothetical protein